MGYVEATEANPTKWQLYVLDPSVKKHLLDFSSSITKKPFVVIPCRVEQAAIAFSKRNSGFMKGGFVRMVEYQGFVRVDKEMMHRSHFFVVSED